MESEEHTPTLTRAAQLLCLVDPKLLDELDISFPNTQLSKLAHSDFSLGTSAKQPNAEQLAIYQRALKAGIKRAETAVELLDQRLANATRLEFAATLVSLVGSSAAFAIITQDAGRPAAATGAALALAASICTIISQMRMRIGREDAPELRRKLVAALVEAERAALALEVTVPTPPREVVDAVDRAIQRLLSCGRALRNPLSRGSLPKLRKGK